MPGYEPFLLCDFHVHTRWSDGRLSLREVVDLYGKTGRFDVIAITDHILMKRDLLARAAKLATLGQRDFSVTEARFAAYLADIHAEARRARRLYDLLVVPGAEITQNHLRSRKSSHIIALDIKEYISADQPAEEILRAIRAQGALSIACHPHHRTTRRIEIGTCYLWDHRKRVSELVDVWEAANRDDLFSVTSLKHYPYVANSDFNKPKHLHSWKTLVRAEKTWEAVAAALLQRGHRADALPQRLVGALKKVGSRQSEVGSRKSAVGGQGSVRSGCGLAARMPHTRIQRASRRTLGAGCQRCARAIRNYRIMN